jgi:NAD(P)-dependent dehydrogenase (short-subunit alcohol dehydrogenase family)
MIDFLHLFCFSMLITLLSMELFMKLLPPLLFLLCALFITPVSAADKGTVLVTGANRGLGLELVKQFTRKGYQVVGTARKPALATALKATGARVEQLDVANPASIAALVASLNDMPIDIVINNAGVNSGADNSLATLDFDAMERTFQINSLGPLRVTQALMPNLQAGDMKTIINMSSRLGSIELSTGGLYGYRTSKTALNQINKILSVELKSQGFTCVVLHPGWVQTDMGGSEATYTVVESITALMTVIEGLSPKDTGKFYDLKGQALAW